MCATGFAGAEGAWALRRRDGGPAASYAAQGTFILRSLRKGTRRASGTPRQCHPAARSGLREPRGTPPGPPGPDSDGSAYSATVSRRSDPKGTLSSPVVAPSLLSISRAIFQAPPGSRLTINSDFPATFIGSPPAFGVAVSV